MNEALGASDGRVDLGQEQFRPIAGDVRQQFAASPEAQNDLNALYRQVFGRDADASGLATYTGLLANGSSLTAVQLILAQSLEAQIDIGAIYQEVLGRAPDGGGLTTYMG